MNLPYSVPTMSGRTWAKMFKACGAHVCNRSLGRANPKKEKK